MALKPVAEAFNLDLFLNPTSETVRNVRILIDGDNLHLTGHLPYSPADSEVQCSVWDYPRGRSLKEMKKYINVAENLDIRRLVMHPGRDWDPHLADVSHEYVVNSTIELAKYARERGIVLGLEHPSATTFRSLANIGVFMKIMAEIMAEEPSIDAVVDPEHHLPEVVLGFDGKVANLNYDPNCQSLVQEIARACPIRHVHIGNVHIVGGLGGKIVRHTPVHPEYKLPGFGEAVGMLNLEGFLGNIARYNNGIVPQYLVIETTLQGDSLRYAEDIMPMQVAYVRRIAEKVWG